MRFLVYIAIFIGFLPLAAHAQTLYNSSGSSGSGTLYNAPSGSSGPLNLRAYARGNTSSSSGRSARNSYNGKSYGIDRSSYSLALSPTQVQANQRRRAKDEARRAYEKKQAQLKNATAYDPQSETENYLNQFQSNSASNKRNAPATRKRVVYKRNSDLFNTPRRVFNTPY
jgi:hypothetical protein